MGRNSKSLNHQLHQRMQALVCFGESKHQAKEEYKKYCEENGIKWNPAKSVGIHSHNTYASYKQTSEEFSKWVQKEHGIKNISDITSNHVKEYLLFRQTEGKSAYTISKDMAALNKVLGTDLNKKDVGLNSRSYKDVTRSREPKAHDAKVNLNNYKNQVGFAQASGCRRQSMLKVTPKDFARNSSGTVTHVRLVEKGGREREAPILKEYQQKITELVDLKTDLDKPMFEKYPSRIDNHAFRAEYAQNRYNELLEQKGYSDNDYRGYDKECIQQLSLDLGHNRLSVVVEHYLRA